MGAILIFAIKIMWIFSFCDINNFIYVYRYKLNIDVLMCWYLIRDTTLIKSFS
jgi:hypothetical protein